MQMHKADHLPEPELEEEREQAEFIGAVKTELTRAKTLEARNPEISEEVAFFMVRYLASMI